MYTSLKKLWPYIRPYQHLAISASIMTILFAGLAQVDPYLTGVIIDGVLTGQPSSYVVQGVLIIIGVTLIRSLLRYIYFIQFEKLSQKIVYALRQDAYKKLQSLDFKYFDETPTGKIMSKMTGDMEAVRHFFAWITHVGIFHVCVFIFAIIAMLTINPLLCTTLILIVPFVVYFSIRLSKSVRPSFSAIREQFARLNTVVQENISGNRIVKAFARETYEIEKFDIENEAFREKNMQLAKVREDNLPFLEAFAILFNVVVLSIGSLMIINDYLTIGELVAFNRLLWMINNPMRMIGPLVNGSQNFMASYERIEELMNEESVLKQPKETYPGETISGVIEFEDVHFKYEDLPILSNINFKIEPGQTMAIIGATGAGKSTMTSLISRFYDVNSGEIRIDERPIGQYHIQSLRNQISIAMQDIFLFSDTIEGNITYGVPGVSHKKVRVAAEIAGVHEFIHQFPDNYSTVVGERGVGLSGGQRQRIALARAIIEDPSILILDDTTSAVDMETEYKILSELKKTNKDRTTIIIAHRISSVKDADLILVMDNGEIIERGSHEALLDLKGYYYDVFTTQMGEFDYLDKEGA